MNAEIRSISEALLEFQIIPIVFVDEFKFTAEEEKQMMQQAMYSIDDCDLLIAEVSVKGIGIGVEAGYAKAKGKPVIYLRNKSAEHSTTVAGISDYQVIYDDVIELKHFLKNILSQVSP